MNLVLVGATGLVGRKMIQLLEERNFQIDNFYAVASERSVGKEVLFRGKPHKIISVEESLTKSPHIAIFSAGGSTSKQWAPKFAEINCFVIDNSSAWRMEAGVPLVVPEINGTAIGKTDYIIANPNCSTIQMVLALSPLHNKYKIKRVVVSTYQSVTGSGAKGINQLMAERNNESPQEKAYPHPIDMNIIPHAGDFVDDNYTTEEVKLVNETQKILDENIKVTATVVRVPVDGGHSEAVNLEFENDFTIFEVTRILGAMRGLVVFDIPEANMYPMPYLAKDKDEVFVGRIRRDMSQEKSLNLWIVSDNLRKGAATNAIQIAEYLVVNKFITK
ncbi:MAG: aspartate-semialdehyde dehydrogenase [Marinilabiliales bacterium]|nr:MAG: aspartate-semialdehyde dehydrogenase [Marinilabiliales bacterium]